MHVAIVKLEACIPSGSKTVQHESNFPLSLHPLLRVAHHDNPTPTHRQPLLLLKPIPKPATHTLPSRLPPAKIVEQDNDHKRLERGNSGSIGNISTHGE